MATVGRPVLREGIIAGLIGAAVVAVWFLILDVARGRPFLTPTILRAAVFFGDWGRLLWEGVVAGLAGAVIVAIWFLVVDTIQGEPLRTPRILGEGLLRQTSATDAIALYTVAHGLAFIAFGIVASTLVAAAE